MNRTSKFPDITNKGTADKPLTEQQRLFVRFHVHEQMNMSAAARAAGYRGNVSLVGMTLLKNPAVQAAVAVAREEYRVASQMTRKKVIEGFAEAINIARTQAEPMAMISGWREIGRICGLYEPTKTRVDLSVSGSIMIQKLETMTDAELLQLMQEAQDPPQPLIEGDFSEADD